jgi:hypothetical protein
MSIWLAFWTVALIVSGISFAAITLIVSVKGVRDIREAFYRLAMQGMPRRMSEASNEPVSRKK